MSTAVPMCESNRCEPVIDRLRNQLIEVEKRAANLRSAIEKLESNPEVSELLESLNKLGHY